MNISDFVTQIGKAGLARSNRYSIEMSLPATTYTDNDYRKMLLLCENVQLPGLNLNTSQIRTFGEVREMPYEFNYDPVQFSFYVDGDMVIKGIFDQWIQSVQRGATRNFNYYKDYISDQVKISVEDLTDQTKYIVTLYEAYPKNLSAVQMGYDQKDVMKLNVTLMYKHWKSEVISKREAVAVKTLPVQQTLPETSTYTNTVTNYTDPMGNTAFNF